MCTIGGGSGMPVVNSALVKAGFRNIQSVVTTFDNGGDTGRIRTDERGRTLALSDYWRSLVSLWIDGAQKEKWLEMLRFRDGRGRNFGNAFFQFLLERAGDGTKVDSMFAELTGAELAGEVIPVSSLPAQVSFEVQTGRQFTGEQLLDDLRMSLNAVTKIWLTPEVPANPEAVVALKNADVIILCPGSMYGSVLANFLPLGMKEAFVDSKAKKILMTNLMSVANENHGYNQDMYVDKFLEYLPGATIDFVLAPDSSIFDASEYKTACELYALDHSFPIKIVPSSTYKTVVADIATIDPVKHRFRHSEEKLAEYFKSSLI